ncbi:unnamed protein product [Lepeophtheirus salmonis]|uniref:(salmon louse) hypothetical protein n=1 Tax=Lepeophtheirus salmonis TaxID=72036 RepID=A0A7R8H511_LEPSM|nr:unnamed protein product [Lepeophtheirus salmonis]CAF2869949.1 unnamed protein product [Lepeophtheirus salmonis]
MMKKLIVLILFLILNLCELSIQRSLFKVLRSYLQIFKDSPLLAVTIISETKLACLEELVFYLTELNIPISIINLDEYNSNEDIREAISIQGTFIVVVNDHDNTIDFIRKIPNEVMIINPYIIVPHPDNLLPNSSSFNFKIDWRGNGRILEVYRIQHGQNLIISPIYLVRSFIFLYGNLDFIWSRRRNLQGMHFRIGYINDKFYFTFDDETGPAGIFYELYKIMKENLNITETFVKSVDGYYGTNNESGILGMIYRGELDFSIMDFAMTIDRIRYADLTRGICMQTLRFYSLKKSNAQSWRTFIGVFSNNFWLAVLFCMICSMIISWLAFKIVDNEVSIGLVDSIATPLRTMGALSIPETPIRAPGRILMVTICFVGAMIYWVYNAGLTSLLTVDESPIAIQSLQDFLTKPEYQILIAKGTTLERLFIDAEKHNDKEMAEIYQKTIKPNPEATYSNLDEAKYRIFNNSKYILLLSEAIFDTQFINESCFFQKSTTENFKTNIAWITKKRFRYLELFNFHLTKLIEAGYLNRIYMRLGTGKTPSCEKDDFTPIKINNAPVYSSVITTAEIMELHSKVLLHPQYSSDLVLNDSSSFQTLKKV